jgi:hypothetical protein
MKSTTIAAAADAELTLYKQEPSIQLRDEEGTLSCPLTWWQFSECLGDQASVYSSNTCPF